MSKARQVSTVVVVVAAVALVLGAGVVALSSLLQSKTSLAIGDGVFQAQVALTESARQKGLAGVESLAADDAMILAYPTDGLWQIWMKDMKIPIDIVWVDKDKKIVYIVKNVPPEGGESTRFKPDSPARYIIELPAGTVDNLNITVGRSAIFTINEDDVRP